MFLIVGLHQETWIKMRCNEIQIKRIKNDEGRFLVISMRCFKTGIFIPIDTEVKELCDKCDKDTHGELFDEERT